MRKINDIIIHCTATKEGREVTVEEVDRWHRKNGWSGVGYHYLIYLDGSIHQGRDISKAGAHCYGHNRNSIGVCYVGGLDSDGKPKDTRTDAQKKALRQLVAHLKTQFPGAEVHGHCDYAAKACPCFDAHKEF